MGKNEFLTPKAIANRIKAKGLQKLRWYCQMCQKQCRDENGFKCHCMSESHQRQMQVFGMNPNRFIHGFSEEFERSFLEHFKRSHRFSRVAATVLYNEYISDRHHIHMNSTQWATLTEFVKYLGRTGKCKVEETEKGWFLTYIDREPETLLRESQKKKREKAEIADEERHEREVQQQIERAAKTARMTENAADDPSIEEKKFLKRSDGNEKLAFSFGFGKSKNGKCDIETNGLYAGMDIEYKDALCNGKDAIRGDDLPDDKDSDKENNLSNGKNTDKNIEFNGEDAYREQSVESHGKDEKVTHRDDQYDLRRVSCNGKSSSVERAPSKELISRESANVYEKKDTKNSGKGGLTALEELMAEEERKKEKINRKDYWLTEGLIVKVMSKSLASHGYYKQKGVVREVIGKYVGEIKMIDSGALLKVDQEELETVIPQIGGLVKIVNGAYRGYTARLLSVDIANYTAKVQIDKGKYDGRVLNAIDYEDICKFSLS